MYLYHGMTIGVGLPRYKGIGVQIMERMYLKDRHLWQGLKSHAIILNKNGPDGTHVTWTLTTKANIPGFKTQVFTPTCWRPGLSGNQYTVKPGIKWPANSIELTQTQDLVAYSEAHKEQLLAFVKEQALEAERMQNLIDVLEYAGLIQH